MANELGVTEYNKYVDDAMSIDNDNPNFLFVCEGNAQRSPTFEKWFKLQRKQYNVKSTGTAFAYENPLTSELLTWADVIYCMDLEQCKFISRKFPQFIGKVEIVGCSDQYSRMSPQLCRLIEFWVERENL